MHPYLTANTPFVIAHRGGPERGLDICENSDQAFARAVGLGVRYLETDIRTTVDGVPVLQHDDDLTRVAHYAARISDLPWSEVRRISLPGEARIVRLDEAITAWPSIRWNIDIKDDRSLEPTVAAVRRAQALDRVCLTSFSHNRVLRVRDELGAAAATGATWQECMAILRVPSPGRAFAGRWRARFGSPVAVQVPVSMYGVRLITRRSVAAAHAAGVQVHAWVINDPEQMRALLDIGVDALVTDEVSTALAVLAER